MAQQASPKLMGQREDFRAQFVTASRVVVRTFASNCRSSMLITTSRAYGLWRMAYGSEETLAIWLSAICYTPFALLRSVPFQRPLLPRIPVPHQQNSDEQPHFQQAQEPQLAELHRPGKHEHDLDIENNEEH